MNFDVEPSAVVATLGTAKRQMVEIARAVYYQAQVIIFDEPTASLTPEETQHLFLLIEDLRRRGLAIIFIDGIAYVTEDRKVSGFFETMTVDDNIYLGWLCTPVGRRRLRYSTRHRDEVAANWVDKTRITAINRESKIIELSGGNQQKVVVAKTLVQEPSLIILDEPTRGVDVGAVEEIHEIIRGLANDGKAVVVISSYLPEILKVSDRILVARGGQIVAEFDPEEATQEKIMYAAVH